MAHDNSPAESDKNNEEPRPKTKPAGMSKRLLFGLIGGGLATVGAAVLLIVLLSGGSSPKPVMEELIRAGKPRDYGTLYDNMSTKYQQQFANWREFPTPATVEFERGPFTVTRNTIKIVSVTATDPRDQFIELMTGFEKHATLVARFLNGRYPEQDAKWMKQRCERFGGLNPLVDWGGEAEILNETVKGDRATVHVRYPNGREVDFSFVKENGEWKLDGE